MFRRDWLMRLIEEIAQFLAKITGLVDKRDADGAIAMAARAWSETLDVPRELVDRVDAPTLANLLRDPAKQRAAAQLLLAEATAHAAKSDPVQVAVCRRHALELYLEARAAAPEPADDAVILELTQSVRGLE